MSGLHCDRDSPVRSFAEAVGWLWRLPVSDTAAPGLVGLGGVDEAGRLEELRDRGELADTIVFAGDSGPALGGVPARRRVEGVARFARGAALSGAFTVFEEGVPVVRTRRGAHAVRCRPGLAIGFDPVAQWGRLGLFWVLGAVADALVAALDRPLIQLPPVGCIRFDDLPGTAQQQLNGDAKPDAKVLGRIEGLHRTYERAGAKLSVAVVANALDDEQEPVPMDTVWPQSTAALGAAVRAGVFEPVLHGWIHFDANNEEWEGPGDVEPREFLRLPYEEAGRRLDEAMAWQREHLGQPPTFVAPAWGYSEGTAKAAAERGLPAWRRAAPEPLLVDGNPRETLIGAGGPGGVHRLDYGALARLAAVGLPPTPVLHGGLLDDRLTARLVRDAFGYARLMLKRDAERLPFVEGVDWISAGDLVDRLAAHGRSEYRDGEVVLPDGTEAVVIDRDGRRTVRG